MQSGLAAIAALLLTPIQQPSPANQVPNWLTDYETARTTARSQGRPIFAVFT
jgi:hypothetical protein